jgi:hypothetical protein
VHRFPKKNFARLDFDSKITFFIDLIHCDNVHNLVHVHFQWKFLLLKLENAYLFESLQEQAGKGVFSSSDYLALESEYGRK